jgi:outer membrane autotransporter protein
LGGSNQTLTINGGLWDRSSSDLRIDGTHTVVSFLGGTMVTNGAGIIGSTISDVNNSVYVGGSNSIWVNNGDLTIGLAGSDNSLSITNNGRVENINGTIGASADAAGNSVLVDGADSVWNNASNLVVGAAGSGNTLDIENGGLVNSVTGFVGRIAGSSNNVVTVSGSGSHWNNTGDLIIGSTNGSGNKVRVSDGGMVSAYDLMVYEDNTFNINAKGTLAIGGDFNLKQQTNVNWETNGRLIVGGLLDGMSVNTNTLAGSSVFLNKAKDLTLDGGAWLNGNTNLIVGLFQDTSILAITNGGAVANGKGYIGWGNSSENNSVIVGADSSWTNSAGGLYVGRWLESSNKWVNADSGNSLTVQSNGWVLVGEAVTNGLPGGMLVASTNGAEVVVGGKKSSVTVEQALYVGMGSSATGRVEVLSGGTASVGELVLDTSGSFELRGTLEVENDFNISQAGVFSWYDGGTLSVGGELTGITALGGKDRTLVIDDGLWDLTGTDLYVTGTNTALQITGGGSVTNASAFIGNSTNDFDNTVSVSDSGSVWSVTESLVIGNGGSTNNEVKVENNGHVDIGENLTINPGNTLRLSSTGLVTVAGNMTVSNAVVAGSGTVEFDSGSNLLNIYGTNSSLSADILFNGLGGSDTVAFTDNELLISETLTNRFVGFENLLLTNSLLGGAGTLDGFGNVTVSGGRINPTGTLRIDGNFDASDTILEVIAGIGSLHVTNSLDVSSMGADVAIRNGLSVAGLTNSILVADGGISGMFAATNITEHYLLYDFVLEGSSGTNVNVVAQKALNGTISSVPAYAAVQGVRAAFNGMQNAVFTRTKQLRRNLVATAHAIPHEAYLLSEPDEPQGPQGPGDNNTIFGMHFWAQQYSGKGEYDRQGQSSDFTLRNNGTTIGLDRLFGEALVAGINYTYARSTSSADNGDHVETENYWVGLYGEYVTETGLFVDALLGAARSNYESERRDTNYRGEADFRGYDIGGHVDVGNYFHYEDWALAPYVGLHYLMVNADDYTEMEANGNTIHVDETDVSSLESVLGVKLRNRVDTNIGRIQTTAYVEWMHDFLNEDIENTLSDGSTSVKWRSVPATMPASTKTMKNTWVR